MKYVRRDKLLALRDDYFIMEGVMTQIAYYIQYGTDVSDIRCTTLPEDKLEIITQFKTEKAVQHYLRHQHRSHYVYKKNSYDNISTAKNNSSCGSVKNSNKNISYKEHSGSGRSDSYYLNGTSYSIKHRCI